jgi:hypothetical protein
VRIAIVSWPYPNQVLDNKFPGRAAAQENAKADYRIVDEAGQLDPQAADEMARSAEMVRAAYVAQGRCAAESDAQWIVAMDPMQNLPVVQHGALRVFLESPLIKRMDFKLAYLKGGATGSQVACSASSM